MGQAAPRRGWGAFVAYGLAGMVAMPLYGYVVVLFLLAAFGGECGLECLMFVPIWMGLALAGLALGAWTAWKPGKPARVGWIAVGLAVPVLVPGAFFLAQKLTPGVLSSDELAWALPLGSAAALVTVFSLAHDASARLAQPGETSL